MRFAQDRSPNFARMVVRTGLAALVAVSVVAAVPGGQAGSAASSEGRAGCGMHGGGSGGQGAGPGCGGGMASKDGESHTCPMMGSAAGQGAGAGRHGGGQGRGMGRGGRGMGGGPPAVMQTAMSLVHDYRGSIERTIEVIPNGVITTTVSTSDADAANAIERHVLEMKGLLDDGGRVRNWDPLFREIFDHRAEISMKIETVEGGVRVTETSDNPDVAALIKAHAEKVSDFIARGPEAVHESTPLPEGYGAAADEGGTTSGDQRR